MKVIGLTGGIACGKSTVSARLAGFHAIPIVDSDRISRIVVEPGRSANTAIRSAFGDDVRCRARRLFVVACAVAKHGAVRDGGGLFRGL